MKTGQGRAGLFFGIGFMAGMLPVLICRRYFLEELRLLGEDALFQLKYMSIDEREYFVCILVQRLLFLILMALLLASDLAPVFMAGITLWAGATLGIFLTTLTLQYGLKGQVLALVWLFPQFLLYAPAFYLLIRWGMRVHEEGYRSGEMSKIPRKYILRAGIGRLLAVLLLTVGGCILEGYLSPGILQAYLKIF